MATREAFEGWAFLELMGHRKLAGYLSEASVGGASMLRIDVPSACENGASASWCPEHGTCSCPPGADRDSPDCALHSAKSEHPKPVQATQFYAPAAVYAVTPTTEDMARRFAARCKPQPVEEWELPDRPALPAAGIPEVDTQEEPF